MLHKLIAGSRAGHRILVVVIIVSAIQRLTLKLRVRSMMKREFLRTALSLLALLVLLPILGGAVSAETPEPSIGPGDTVATSVPTGLPENGEIVAEPPTTTATGVLDEVLETRTPVPTATPGVIEQGMTKVAARAGLDTPTFLGLSIGDWVNLALSMLWVLFGYLLGTWLVKGLLPRAVRGTATEFDDRLLKATGSDIRWLVVLLILHFSTARLTFVGADLKAILQDVYFLLGLAVGFRIVWRLMNLGGRWYRERAAQVEREEQLDPIITLLVRLGQGIAIVIAVSIVLSHFGVDVIAFAAVLGIGGLALSLAAKDVVSDAIDGFIILVDQPFRIGDRIEIQGASTWGDVVDIGLRTTRIRTRDNRMVIVPNSMIGANQVVNYSYPDPRYRIQTHVGIAYSADIEAARSIIVDTVRQIEGVLSEESVDVLYIEMGDSARILRVRWWIESYVDTRRIFDRVHTAIDLALDDAGIESPFPTQSLNLQVEQATLEGISQTLRGQHPAPSEA
jgi:small-conductance mechanosensitive channel